MKPLTRAVVTFAVLLSTSSALAPSPAGAALTQEGKCREAVSKSARSALNIVVTARAQCLLHRLRGMVPAGVNCMADPTALGGAGTGDAKTDEALASLLKWRDRRLTAVGRACQGVDLQAAGVAGACSPAAGTAAAVAECAVFDVGKAAGDALADTLDVPFSGSEPPGLARKCFKVLGLTLGFGPRSFARIRGECLAEEEELGGNLNCRVTVAPPGIVNPTGSAEIDDALLRRAQRWRGRITAFCEDVNLSTINFTAAMGDPTGAPFTLTDLLERSYDAILDGASTLDEAIFVADPYCGDGVTGAGEECDDGDSSSCDGCDRDCSTSGCGNGAVCTPESCDDGNNTAGDGCSAGCNIEAPGCGNSVQEPGEQCDDGPANSDTTPNACRTDCTLPTCGDNVTDSGEECDPPDGVTCDASCQLLLCGNGLPDPGEQCDDGGESNGCDDDCTFVVCPDGNHNGTAGEVCDGGGNTASCDNDCTLPVCPDGVFNAAAGEECDDGDSVDGDGCDSNCTLTGCGNGIVTAGEDCDDGNTMSGDGCSATCTCTGESGCFTQDESCPDLGELILLAGTGNVCANNGDCLAGTCNLGIGRCVTSTELDTGWTGLAHDSDINHNVRTLGDLLCPGPAPVCGQCEVVGINPGPGYCRCANNNRTVCDQPFVADADDCGGQICNCYFGAPLPLSSGNTPACVVNKFANDISGTANIDTGSGEITANLAAVVYLGISLVQPCPTCGGTCSAPASSLGDGCGGDLDCDSQQNCASNVDCTNAGGVCFGAPTGKCFGDGTCGSLDPTPNDGVRGGTCFGGDNNGQTCDSEGFSTSFPGPDGGYTSLDCFPGAAVNASGSGLSINLTQRTGASSLSAGVVCGFPPAVPLACPCGVCSGNTAKPCTNNGDCTGVGNCQRTSPSGAPPQPNQCDDLACSAAGGGEGVCAGNAANDKYCDGIVRSNGEGYIQCQGANADCAPTNIGLPGGNCTIEKTRECFLNPITVTGSADPETPLGAATFCIPPTSNPAINTVAGLPGPGRIKNQARSTTFCASDHNVAYQPGVGGCP